MKKFTIISLSLSLLIIYNLICAFNKVSMATAQMYVQQTVIIDAGHGGEDGGAVGVDSVMEKDINLQISLALKKELEDRGIAVIMTRADDVDFGDDNLNTVSERKKSDMNNRLEIINSNQADLVISIHQNYFEQEKYRGTQIFYGNIDSKNLAETLQSDIVENLQPKNNRLATFVDTKYLLNNANKKMLIVECGFISNIEECENLQNKEYQTKLARTIANSIEKNL